MSRFGNFRNKMRSGYNSFRNSSYNGYKKSRRVYQSKTLGMKNSSLIKLAVIGGLLYFFKDKIKPFISSLLAKK